MMHIPIEYTAKLAGSTQPSNWWDLPVKYQYLLNWG
jgi:hypothetical protein